MKKGLLIYKASTAYKNIGDYIQSIAAEQYTGKDVVLIEREHLHEYSGEPVKLIMNGWYMHIPENWPPSRDIIPLLTSIHITPNIGDRMLTEKGIEFFKHHGPVGCRDKDTQKLLESKGIPTYFSNCLTLTLGKTFKHNSQSKKVRIVDPYFEISKKPTDLISYFFISISHKRVIKKIAVKLYKDASIKSLMKASAFYRAYSKIFKDEILENAEYLTHRILETELPDEEAKFEYSRKLLNKYADACLVITSRIHAALPSLAIGTPVIFVTSDYFTTEPTKSGRFNGVLELFHVLTYADFKLQPAFDFKPNEKIGLNHTIRNKKDYLKIAEELDKTCKDFINDEN